jgi:hypothetical protein
MVGGRPEMSVTFAGSAVGAGIDAGIPAGLHLVFPDLDPDRTAATTGMGTRHR